MKLSPLIKGLITAVVMIGFSLIAYYFIPPTSPLHWLVYAIFALGISWTLISWKKSPAYTGKFGDSFNTGFRCFIVATLLMTLYSFTFNKMHPEFAEQSAQLYKEQQLAKKDNSKTPVEIEEEASRYKNGYAMAVVYGSIFGYLIIGAVVTAAASFMLIISNRRN
jgi:Protein of unknown function (DUF4199)